MQHRHAGCLGPGMRTSNNRTSSRICPERFALVPSILAIGLEDAALRDARDFDTSSVDTPAEILESLNILHVDLVLGGPLLCDDSIAELAEGLGRQFPFQRWAIISQELALERECTFRALGSMGVFDNLFTCLHYASLQSLHPPNSPADVRQIPLKENESPRI
jgi:hypothetical protein